MSRYTVRFDTGAETTVELPYYHPSPETVMEAVREANPDQIHGPIRITRDQGRPGEQVIWKLPRDAVEAKEQQNHIMGRQEVRLFVSFAYDQADIDGVLVNPENAAPAGTVRTVFGSALLDMEFEPFEQGHLDHLTAMIAEHTGVSRVVLMGWQEVTKP